MADETPTPTAPTPEDPQRDQGWQDAYARLMGDKPYVRYARRFWRMLPSAPRCRMCNGPFGGPLQPIMHAIGKAPWPNNPHFCSGCFRDVVARRVGAEIECSLLFADVRGSTAMAEKLRPSEFRAQMDRFFSVAAARLIDHEAIIDKFVGDEVVAIFVPGLTGGKHAAKAIAAGRSLLRATAADGESPMPIGIGVNTGVAYVGAVGSGENVTLSAMGDAVNVAARLASTAGAGELLVSAASAVAGALDEGGAEQRRLELKGKSEPVEVVVLR
ncbi:MAG: adenylate/guanylate cyclase domain-containing protein [Chloroflexi bacterium]|nr:adenylate/guanylate cyclase domain-containing protein [Chloroflexota bacterium]